MRSPRQQGLPLGWRVCLCAALLIGTFGPPHAAAQEVASEESDNDGFLTRAEAWVDDHPRRALADLKRYGFYPRVVTFAPGTGPSPGLDYYQPDVGGLDMMLSVAASFRGDALLQGRLGKLPGPAKALRLRAGRHSLEGLAPFRGRQEGESPYFAYLEYTNRDLDTGRFYLADAGQLRYHWNDSAFDVVGGYAFSRKLAFSARAGWYTSQIETPEDGTPPPSLAQPAGEASVFGRRIEFGRLGAEAAFDSRDIPNNPHSGSFLAASWWLYEDKSYGIYSFNRVRLDARHFQPLGSERHVVALRAFASLSNPSGEGIPFHLQDALGGSRVLRGYPSFRFRGNRLRGGSAEYRFEAHRKVELAAFADFGRVSGGLTEAAGLEQGLLWSYGAGVRFKTPKATLFRLDVARGGEGIQIHLKLGYSF